MTLRSRLRITLTTCFIGIMVVACTPKSVERKPHQKKPDIGFVDTSEDPELEAQFNEVILSEYARRTEYDTFLSKAPTDENEIFASVLDPLSSIVLSNQYFYMPRWSSSTELIELLGYYNRALGILIENSTPENRSDRLAGVIEKYLEIMFSACRQSDLGVNIARGCHNLPTFTSDFATNRVLLLLAGEASGKVVSSRQTYRTAISASVTCAGEVCTQARLEYLRQTNHLFNLLKVVRQSRSRTTEPELVLLWQRHAEDNHFFYSQSATPMDRIHREMNCRAFSSSLQNIELTENTTDEEKQQYFDILDRFRPYDPVSEDTFCVSNMEQIRSDWFQHRLFSGGDYDPTGMLQLYLNESQTLRPELLNQSNVSGLRQSEKIHMLRKNRYFANSLSVRGLRKDLVFYIVDEVFHNRLSIENATLIWNKYLENQIVHQGEHSTRGELAQALYVTMNSYLRNEIAYLALRSNEHFRDFFENRSFNSKDILKTFVSHARILSTRWRELKDGSDRLLLFIEDSLEREFTDRASQDYENFQTQKSNLKSVDKAINLVSVLPHMLMLSYFLVKFDGKAEIYIWWLRDTREITLAGLVKRLLTGAEKDVWLDYGDPNQTITHYLMIHAFDFWVRTDVMASYASVTEETDSEGESSIVNEETFFNTIIDKYIKEDADGIEEGITDFNTLTDAAVSNFHSRCRFANQSQTMAPDSFVKSTYLDTKAAFFTDMYAPIRKGALSEVRSARISFEPKFKTIRTFRATLQLYKDNPVVDLAALRAEAQSLRSSFDGQETEDQIEQLAGLERVIEREALRRQNVDLALANIDRRLENMRNLRNELLSKAKAYFDNFYIDVPTAGDPDSSEKQNCLRTVVLEENRRRVTLAQMEISYFKDVHAAMWILKIAKDLQENTINQASI
ncbi:MAG: hypothetical protein AAF202_00710, partial [Pseudomonadota bacterium]